MSFITGFRTSIASSSRHTLPPLPLAPSFRAFHSSPISLASRERRKRVKAKLDRNLALHAARKAEEESHRPDPVLGHITRPDGTGSGSAVPWDTCRLKKVLLRPEDVYNAPLTNFAAGQQPEHILPGLNEEDKQVLLGALPFANVSLKGVDGSSRGLTDSSSLNALQRGEEIKSEQMLRLLDLRNANKAGIEVVNRQRVIEEFGRKTPGAGIDTGSSEVQAALLTHKIRSLAEHLSANPKDNANKRSLRSLVHKRQQVLKYYARKEPAKYEPLLADLGLERRAVEGELTL